MKHFCSSSEEGRNKNLLKTHAQKGLYCLRALSTRVHLCSHPCELLQLDSVEEVGCKGRKKKKKKVNTSEMNCQRKVKQCVHADWKQRLEKLSN